MFPLEIIRKPYALWWFQGEQKLTNLLNIRNLEMILKQREYEIFGMEQIRIYIYRCFYVTIASPVQFPLSFLNVNWTQQKILVKMVPHRPAQTEKGLQWFKMFFRLPDNSTTNSYSYNYFHNIFRLFGVLPNFPFTTSETSCGTS